jgi:hypothetical protein
MSVSHPHLLQLIVVEINLPTGPFLMISERMMNGNVKDYINRNPVDISPVGRLRLVREPLSCTSDA